MDKLRHYLYFPLEKRHALFLLLLIPTWAFMGTIVGDSFFELEIFLNEPMKPYIPITAAIIFSFNGFLVWTKSSRVYVSDQTVIRTTVITTVFLSIMFYLSYVLSLHLTGGAKIIFFEYDKVNVTLTAINSLRSFILLSSYLTADYLFRSNAKRAYIVRKSRKNSINILNSIKREGIIEERDKEKLLDNLKNIKNYRGIMGEPIYHKEKELAKLWSSAADKILNVVKSGTEKIVLKRIRLNKKIFNESVEDLEREVGDL